MAVADEPSDGRASRHQPRREQSSTSTHGLMTESACDKLRSVTFNSGRVMLVAFVTKAESVVS